jgi:hypothetical protein
MIVSYLIWKRSVDKFIPVYIETKSKKVYKIKTIKSAIKILWKNKLFCIAYFQCNDSSLKMTLFVYVTEVQNVLRSTLGTIMYWKGQMYLNFYYIINTKHLLIGLNRNK